MKEEELLACVVCFGLGFLVCKMYEDRLVERGGCTGN